MKKLTIGAIVALFGIAAHAGAITWDITDLYTYVGPTESSSTLLATEGVDSSFNYAVYLFTTADITRDDAIDSIKNNDFSFYSKGSLANYGMEAGEAAGESKGYDGGKYDVYYVVFNNETPTDSTAAYVSEVTKDVNVPEKVSGTFNTTGAASASGANWTAAAPEPTSGLLLLLGVAGLALRRRRA